jgi:hypothetical protein
VKVGRVAAQRVVAQKAARTAARQIMLAGCRAKPHRPPLPRRWSRAKGSARPAS